MDWLRNIVEDPRTERFIMTLIVLNAITLGLKPDAQCVQSLVAVPEGNRLKLRSRVRGQCSGDTGAMPRDEDRLRMICRPGAGPTVPPTHTFTPTPTATTP